MRNSRGQTAAEYMGVLFVAAVLVATVAATNVGPAISSAVSATICRLAHDGGCEAAAPKARAAGERSLFTAGEGEPLAHAANIPCDGMSAKVCSALRAMINRAQAEHQRFVEAYKAFALDFVNWIGGAERVTDLVSIVNRPGFFKAVNALITRKVNREGARLLTSIRDPKLWNIVRSQYRYGARIGKGSTADALRDEVARGVPHGARGSHYVKAEDTIRGLNNVLTKGGLSARERQIATNIRGELWTALPPQYRPPLR